MKRYKVFANQLGVELTGNIPPIALSQASNGQTITEGETFITLFANNSTDADGEIVKVEWIENGVVFANAMSFDKSDFAVGEHLITLAVTDDDGATSFDPILITCECSTNTNTNTDANTDTDTTNMS